jgi:hypothetical protein
MGVNEPHYGLARLPKCVCTRTMRHPYSCSTRLLGIKYNPPWLLQKGAVFRNIEL